MTHGIGCRQGNATHRDGPVPWSKKPFMASKEAKTICPDHTSIFKVQQVAMTCASQAVYHLTRCQSNSQPENVWAFLAKRIPRWIPQPGELQPRQKAEKEMVKPQGSKTRFNATCTSHIPNGFSNYNNTVPKRQQRQSQRAETRVAARMMKLWGRARRVGPAERSHQWGGSVKAPSWDQCSWADCSAVLLTALPK